MTQPEQPYRRRVVLNTLSAGVSTSWAIVLAIITVPIMVRGLGSDAFGLWVLLQTFSAITGWWSIVSLALGLAGTRRGATRAAADTAAKLPTDDLAVVAAVGVVAGVLFSLVGPAALTAVFDVPDDLIDSFELATALFGVQIIGEFLVVGVQAVLEGDQRVDLARGIDVVRRTLVLGAGAAVALTSGSLTAVAAASAATTTVAALGAGAYLARRGIEVLAPTRSQTGDLLRYARSVGGVNAAGVLHRTMDRVIAGIVFGPQAVTLVEIATQIQNASAAILSASSYTALSASPFLRARQAERQLRELLLTGSRYAVVATWPVVASSAVLAGPLIAVWVGSAYEEAAGLTAIAVLYVGAAAPVQVGSNLLQGLGRAKTVFHITAVGVVVNLVASLLLANTVGLVGVFLGTLCGTLVWLPTLTRASLQETETDLAAFLADVVWRPLTPIVALLVVEVAVLAAPLGNLATLLLGGGAGLAVYAVVVSRSGLRPADLRQLFALARRPS